MKKKVALKNTDELRVETVVLCSMKQMFSLLIIILITQSLRAQGVSCLQQLVPEPITQKVLVAAKQAYKGIPVAEEPYRSTLLGRLGYWDSTQSIDERLKVQTLGSCGDSVQLVRVQGVEYQVDESIWLITVRDSAITSTTIIASLQTQCDNTFLRACSFSGTDSKLLIQQLNHVFDCSEQEFLRTDKLPSFTVGLDDNNLIQEAFLEE